MTNHDSNKIVLRYEKEYVIPIGPTSPLSDLEENANQKLQRRTIRIIPTGTNLNETKKIIASDGSKSQYKSEGASMIANSSGTFLISGSNPDVGIITSIMAALLFINEYCRYFMITFDSQVNYFCDNLEIVNKILKLIENSNHYDEYINTVGHDAVYLLKNYLPSSFSIQHV